MGSVDMGEYSNSNVKQNTHNDQLSNNDVVETNEDSENTKSDSVTDDKVNDIQFVESDSDDDEKNRFFMSCAENKVNAFIERMREYRENYGRPEEFENEAVSMAIQQHGLKKYQDSSVCYDCNSDLSSSSFNVVNNLSVSSKTRRIREESNDSLETHHDNDKNDSDGEPSRSKKKKLDEYRFNHLNDCNFDFDNVSFLNQAVAVAIEKKGLSSSSCCNMK